MCVCVCVCVCVRVCACLLACFNSDLCLNKFLKFFFMWHAYVYIINFIVFHVV